MELSIFSADCILNLSLDGRLVWPLSTFLLDFFSWTCEIIMSLKNEMFFFIIFSAVCILNLSLNGSRCDRCHLSCWKFFLNLIWFDVMNVIQKWNALMELDCILNLSLDGRPLWPLSPFLLEDGTPPDISPSRLTQHHIIQDPKYIDNILIYV